MNTISDKVTTEEFKTSDFRILLVDDEPELLMSLEDLLSEEGYSVITADSGRQALERLATAPPLFDLVVTDLRMPPPDGLELLKRIKAEWPATEVILLTAFATRETAREELSSTLQEQIKLMTKAGWVAIGIYFSIGFVVVFQYYLHCLLFCRRVKMIFLRKKI